MLSPHRHHFSQKQETQDFELRPWIFESIITLQRDSVSQDVSNVVYHLMSPGHKRGSWCLTRWNEVDQNIIRHISYVFNYNLSINIFQSKKINTNVDTKSIYILISSAERRKMFVISRHVLLPLY